MEKIIDLRNITVSYGDNVILDKLNLYINEKEFITLLGPSGCGKTTTLRCIAGFVQPDSGEVVFEGKVINDVPPHKRRVNTIFQRYALFPHLNVYENIAFGPELQKKSRSEVRQTVAEMLELVRSGYENIVCAQPFGCLPNHICGKGMVNKIRELYPEANITPIDYDPSATRVNQENRIKLMLAVARERLSERREPPADLPKVRTSVSAKLTKPKSLCANI